MRKFYHKNNKILIYSQALSASEESVAQVTRNGFFLFGSAQGQNDIKEGSGSQVKNQYFGDNRDLFTYDLIYQIMKSGLAEHFTFLPMLTGDDSKRHGQKTDRRLAKAGTKNEELLEFLDDCVKNNRRDVKDIGEYFAHQGIRVILHTKNFTNAGREDYFKQIDDELLVKSLVFLDPDIGLEVKNSGKEHVLFAEVKDLYQRMDKSSILMIYQYLPRQPRQEYLNMRCEQLKDKVMDDYPVCIDDNQIAFFFLTKDKALEDRLIKVIGEYNERYS